MKYRAEIDGLRAVAVLPVILFHAGFEVFSGGYVGVDVFFVISGFLITTILLEELEQGTFSIVRFYERRARRILPALFVVMAACVIPAVLWMLPSALRSFGQSLVATSLFLSNFFFAQGASYFGGASELKPLVHTWSLAVEEQFYLIFPVLLYLLWPLGRKWVLGALAVLALVSFGLSEHSLFDFPTKHFYFSPARAWELLAGSFCAFFLFRRPVRPNDLLSAAGVLLIAGSIFTFDDYTPFPSSYTLAPVLGTALIILFCDRGTWVGRALSMKLPVGIGLISYSLYLWHQPLFAFARTRFRAPPSQEVMLALVAVAFGLAYLTWRFVEQPVRRRSVAGTRRAIFGGSAVMMTVFIGLGAVLHLQIIESVWKLPPNAQFENLLERDRASGPACQPATGPEFGDFTACIFGDPEARRSVILYGDSHAQALLGRLADRFAEERIRGIHITGMRGCGIELLLFTTEITDLDTCEANFQQLKTLLRDHADAIILMSRWTQHLYPVAGEVEDLHYTNDAGVKERAYYFRQFQALDADGKRSFSREAKEAAAKRYVSDLASVGKWVVLIYPIPETAWDIQKLNAHDFNVTGTVRDEITIGAAGYLKRHKLILEWFDALGGDRLIKVPVKDLFCSSGPEGRCRIQENGVPLYYDDDHLSYEGAKRVVDPVVEMLKARME